MVTGEKRLNDVSKAEKEWHELLSESTRRTEERMKELKKEGLPIGLDGENHFKDIDDWFKEELKKIKQKYNIQ